MSPRRWQRSALGPLAYYAYWRAWPAGCLSWDALCPEEQRAWAGAAWAIVEALGLAQRGDGSAAGSEGVRNEGVRE